jgi:hypothetical protein
MKRVQTSGSPFQNLTSVISETMCGMNEVLKKGTAIPVTGRGDP